MEIKKTETKYWLPLVNKNARIKRRLLRIPTVRGRFTRWLKVP